MRIHRVRATGAAVHNSHQKLHLHNTQSSFDVLFVLVFLFSCIGINYNLLIKK